MKRIFDIVVSGIFFLVVLLPMAIIALSIMLTSKGPILHWSDRVGRNSLVFKMPKFRTMKLETPDLPTHLMKNPNQYLSSIGPFLRKYSLDELPQLASILSGDMSFVGPRPDMPGYADLLQGKDRLVLSVLPGITGPAQIAYKDEEKLLGAQKHPLQYNDEVIWPDKVRINKEYIENYTFSKDVYYMLKTLVS